MRLCRQLLTCQGPPFDADAAIVFFSAFVSLIYWPTSSVTWLTAIVQYGLTQAMCAKSIMKEFERLQVIFEPFKVRDGIFLFEARTGLRAIGRDKDRGHSVKRFSTLAGETAEWLLLSYELADLLSAPGTFSVCTALDLFHAADLESYKGEDTIYATLGLVRLLGLMYGKKFEDSPSDWKKMSRMSLGVRKKLDILGLQEHADAIECRNHLRQTLKLCDYSLSDLIVFVCLLV